MNTTLPISPIQGANPRAFDPLKTNLRRLGTFDSVLPEYSLFRILDQKAGDERVVWNSGSLAEIREAKALFDQLIEQGMVAYKINASSGERSTDVMTEFDAKAEEIVFVPMPQVVGG